MKNERWKQKLIDTDGSAAGSAAAASAAAFVFTTVFTVVATVAAAEAAAVAAAVAAAPAAASVSEEKFLDPEYNKIFGFCHFIFAQGCSPRYVVTGVQYWFY